MHSIDTLNMRSKLVNSQKRFVYNLIKKEGMSSLLRGIQPVMYGYSFGSLIYFFSYAKMKTYFNAKFINNTEDGDSADTNKNSRKMLYATLIGSFISSACAELFSLTFYYPFDLIKTRMQVNNTNHKYNGVLDGAIKIFQSKPSQRVAFVMSLLSPKRPADMTSGSYKLLQTMAKLTNFYKGMLMYSLSYTTFIALEFSLFESFLLYLESQSDCKCTLCEHECKHTTSSSKTHTNGD